MIHCSQALPNNALHHGAGDLTDYSISGEGQLLQQQGLSSDLLLGDDPFASNYPDDFAQSYGNPEEYDYDDYEGDDSSQSDLIAVGMNSQPAQSELLAVLLHRNLLFPSLLVHVVDRYVDRLLSAFAHMPSR